MINFKTYRCLNLPPVGGLNLGMLKKLLLMSNFGHYSDDRLSPSLMTDACRHL